MVAGTHQRPCVLPDDAAPNRNGNEEGMTWRPPPAREKLLFFVQREKSEMAGDFPFLQNRRGKSKSCHRNVRFQGRHGGTSFGGFGWSRPRLRARFPAVRLPSWIPARAACFETLDGPWCGKPRRRDLQRLEGSLTGTNAPRLNPFARGQMTDSIWRRGVTGSWVESS
jgi:hypothetical protein